MIRVVVLLLLVLAVSAATPPSQQSLKQLLQGIGLAHHAEHLTEKGFTIESLTKGARYMPDTTARLLQEAGLGPGEVLRVGFG